MLSGCVKRGCGKAVWLEKYLISGRNLRGGNHFSMGIFLEVNWAFLMLGIFHFFWFSYGFIAGKPLITWVKEERQQAWLVQFFGLWADVDGRWNLIGSSVCCLWVDVYSAKALSYGDLRVAERRKNGDYWLLTDADEEKEANRDCRRADFGYSGEGRNTCDELAWADEEKKKKELREKPERHLRVSRHRGETSRAIPIPKEMREISVVLVPFRIT